MILVVTATGWGGVDPRCMDKIMKTAEFEFDGFLASTRSMVLYSRLFRTEKNIKK